ncbi:hypothetical protein [Mobiluncus mulieris]|uniref:Uncharacterized protein n=1 Tax=Mobiluncus mulieris TaxID=2052 RepID=A0ABD4U0C1_9ACTO|nr:hypothetical protein [Mobiluncus mulieris]MCU9969917.1 hypothetical protein [Mobiluncus mulieris]MCU9974380.1 hypothetical protein [Mobiluncus mulieris]MCV0010461.1 hypothetical protein [Mobiluncus mulieris]NMW76097.1 hypothetical protein [Mobiluncus mulieris]NMX02254.1 hypothetical protein [Mobiluncus mulieris]
MLYIVIAIVCNCVGALLLSHFIWRLLLGIKNPDVAQARQLSPHTALSMAFVSIPLLTPVLEPKLALSVGLYLVLSAVFIVIHGAISEPAPRLEP